MLEMTPAVFAVENEYQILFPVTHPCFAWVKVGEDIYEDAVNGIRNSQNPIHRVRVSAQALDRAGRYTVCCQPVLERKPYYTETGAVQEFSFPFFPVPRENCRVYHISDAHNRLEEPIRAARAFGEIDALILNGDLLNFSHDLDELKNVFRICDALTKGQLPVIFSRGNHDMRGLYGERLVDYSPLWQGKPYYSFRLGGIWGLVLDCGEDKPDDSPEYGGCVACHGFRREETEFLEQMVARKDHQHPEIHTRLIISHMPFTQRNVPPLILSSPHIDAGRILWRR